MDNLQKSRRRFLAGSAFASAGAALISFDPPIATAALQADRPGGTILRGADGALYLIPDDKLRPFRLPESKAAALRAAIGKSRAVDVLPNRTAKRIGLVTGDDDPTLIVIDVGALRQRR
jgi:hypothetical protein